MSFPDDRDRHESPVTPEPTPLEPPASPLPADPSPRVGVEPSTGRLGTAALAAGLLAGLLAGLIGERSVLYYEPRTTKEMMMGSPIDAVSEPDAARAQFRNATIADALLGGLLAGALGVAGGLVSRTPRRVAQGGIAGLLIGAIAGAGAAQAILPAYYREFLRASDELARNMVLPTLVHAGIAAVLGAAGGLGLAIGLGDVRRRLGAIAGGLVGGAIGAIVYQFIGAVAFVFGRASEPVPAEWLPRMLAALCVATLSAVLAAAMASAPATRGRPAADLVPQSDATEGA